jgi:hypothetical protein
MDSGRYWFRRKRIGWGLEPGSRAGWIATAIFVAVDVGGTFALLQFFIDSRPAIPVVWAVFWLIAFVVLALVKGERFWKSPGG